MSQVKLKPKNIKRYRKKLYEMRVQRRLSQYDMATLCGISRTHYEQVENGVRGININKMAKICEVLEYSNVDLFDIEDVQMAEQ